jgi:hypothetical protein
MGPSNRLHGMLIIAVMSGTSFSVTKNTDMERQGFFMHLLNFFDAHSGSIQAITAVILVIVTSIYTILTRTMAKAARDALRPYVYLDFIFPGGSGTRMTVVVGNSGSRAAASVKVRLLKASQDELVTAFNRELFRSLPLATGIGHLSPGTTRKYAVVFPVSQWLADAQASVLDFEITYRDGHHKMTDTQQINFAGYRASSSEDEDQLQKIASELHMIATRGPTNSPVSPSLTKICAYCATRIDQSATKCPNCLEWLPRKRHSWRKMLWWVSN